MYRSVFKRLSDIVFSTLGLIILSPVFVVLTLLLAVVNSGKPFFFQLRPGKNEKTFKLVKFRTMTDKWDVKGELLPDNLRLTGVGSFVRRTSLDEIPQLLNVLKGEMSLIGPRPLLVEYLPLYSREQKRRHNVRPGIAGWAQVNGRNAISWEDKFKLDVWYVDNMSFSLDLKICLIAMKKVILSEGISSGTSVTMEKFSGNK